jgi:mono/diheme cytochrome c family protein
MKPNIFIFFFLVASISLYSCESDSDNVDTHNSDKIVNNNRDTFHIGPKEISIQRGHELFKHNCAMCHSIGGSELTGPGMEGITSQVPQPYNKWLLKYIKNNVAVLKSGDSYARKVYDNSHQTAMTVFDSILTDNQINDIINYLTDPPKAIPQYDNKNDSMQVISGQSREEIKQ